MTEKHKYLSTAVEEEQITIENGGNYPNKKSIHGDSVDEHKYMEEANMYLAGKEIGQQNENL